MQVIDFSNDHITWCNVVNKCTALYCHRGIVADALDGNAHTSTWNININTQHKTQLTTQSPLNHASHVPVLFVIEQLNIITAAFEVTEPAIALPIDINTAPAHVRSRCRCQDSETEAGATTTEVRHIQPRKAITHKAALRLYRQRSHFNYDNDLVHMLCSWVITDVDVCLAWEPIATCASRLGPGSNPGPSIWYHLQTRSHWNKPAHG